MTLRRTVDELDYEDGGDLDRGGPTPADWLALVLNAVRRRKLLTFAVFVLAMAGAVALYLTRPRMYHVETRILAQRQQTLPSIVRPTVEDVPTRTATDLVHRRENLVSVVKQLKLAVPNAPRPRSGVPERAWLAALLSPGGAPVEDDDPVALVVNRIDRSLEVMTGDGTITIALDWPDPEEAYHIVDALKQNFLEARHVQEITAIDDVISLLQGRAAVLREELEKVITEETQRTGSAVADGPTQPAVVRPAVPLSEELVRLKSMLEAKERAVRDVEEFRRRRLADLQAQLDEKRGIYSDTYPAVVSLRQDIEAMSRESPQTEALKLEEKRLREEYSARLAREVQRQGATPSAATARGWRVQDAAAPENERVREARAQYQRMVDRITAAQVDLDAARAAFKSRYNVIWPAEVPKAPTSPKPTKYLGAGLFGALLLALAAAVAPDLLRGRVVERWQVERSLDLPVLAELGQNS